MVTITRNKARTRMVALGVVASGCLMASLAAAGYRIAYPVYVYTSSRQAMGTLGSARNSSDGNQELYCSVYQSVGSAWGSCGATDPSNNSAYCSTSNPALLQQINAVSGDSYVYFSWNADGSCATIGVGNGSPYVPKAP